MMPYITVCLLDAACFLSSIISFYVVFKWTWTWMDESGPSGADITLSTITTQQNEFNSLNSVNTDTNDFNNLATSAEGEKQQSWFTGVGRKAYAHI